ncbi:MAG: hypothetical protein IPG01_03700 [Chitinophagaceae bacterium]|nr:hypothetical protein [Chitinophagaceae bacterium]
MLHAPDGMDLQSVIVHLANKNGFPLSLKHFLLLHRGERSTIFTRVQCSYDINIIKIDSLDPDDVNIGSAKDPISKAYFKVLMKMPGSGE